ncbi:helix-turn-helix domain-containing protein [Muriicola marianensis]|uniref:HTH araC/xylS-type domain-containing protein n=1 Tax=Muriicola marianensis TaxID=1324801 RepID=A0ABQ1QWY4_9FLAO|nr:helix-turn-helix domain-containing protein [Muriicola marianensis]GGD46382.1 hypothetical protein GCM10011361_11650 [Muriicola marianensis]
MGSHSSRDRVFIEKLIEIIEAHLGNDQFGVQELANEIGLSRPHLHRKVSSILGKSTSAFLREYRLSVALELLKEDLLTVSEVAYKVGFASPTYFNTCFHNHFGYPPGEAKFRNTQVLSPAVITENLSVPKKARFISVGILAIVAFLSMFAGVFIYRYVNRESPSSNVQTNSVFPYKNSIAVLPFRNWSDRSGLDRFCDGVTNSVSSTLSEISTLPKVVPFTSVLKYKETTLGATEIAGQLQVDLITQGNIQLASDEILVSVQLIDVYSDDILWSEKFTRHWSEYDAVQIQQSISLQIAQSIQGYISRRQSPRSAKKLPAKTGRLPF